jgi:hypothetical protein
VFPTDRLPAQESQPLPVALNLVIVEGDGAVNNIHDRTAHEPVVRVEDEKHSPVAGAAVVFTVPTEGATGDFANGSKTVTIMSDKQGIAKAPTLRLRQANGKLPIHVTASYRGLSARTTVNQIVEGAPPGAKGGGKGGAGKTVLILGIIGGAAAGGAFYAINRNNGNSTPATPAPPTGPGAIGITPGTGTIAPPH